MKRILIICLGFILCAAAAFAQTRNIRGTVLDANDRMPVIGASVVVADDSGKTLTGASTDIDGKFSIDIPQGTDVVTVSFLGYETEKVNVAGKSDVRVLLSPATEELDAIVVTALGMTREAKSLNYARQEVNTALMDDVKSGDLISGLSGKIAGVQITPAGVSNGTSRIVIRGTSSLTENSMPVFVIDGMVIENQPGDESFSIDGGSGTLDMGNPAADINPDDIETIEVLKGPNAAALYGSRAANGVVLITTKKATAMDRVRVSYNGNLQFERISQLLEYQNGWGTGENNFKLENSTYTLPQDGTRTNETLPDLSGYNDKAGAKLRSWGAPLWDQPIYGHDGLLTTHSAHPENVRDFYSTGYKLSNSVAVDGGSRQNNFRVSFTNVIGNSVVHGINRSNKNTVSARLFNTVAKWLTLDTKVTYSREEVKNRQYMNGSDRNPIYAFVTLPRDLSIETLKHYKDENGHEMIPIGERGYNPYWNIYENTNSDVRSRVTASENIEITIIPQLKLIGRAGIDTYSWNGTEFSNLGARSDVDGGMENWNSDYLSMEYNGIIKYDQKWKNFSVSALVGGSIYYRTSEKRTQAVNSILVAGFENISNSGEYPTVTQTISRKRINSVYGSASFGFKNWLFVDFTARNDWSSTLPIDKCSYFYPSVGGSFVFSDAFHIDPSIISFGKFRASLAFAGSDTSPYRTGQTFSYSGLYNGQPLQSVSTTLNNPDLLPEQTRSFETGLELKFLNNRLGVDFTFYRSDSYNLITSVALSTSSGYSRRYLNAGHIRNHGFEVILTGNPVSTRNFKWNMTLNWAKNNSLVKKVSDENSKVTILTSSNVTVNLEEGRPYGIMRGRVWKTDELGRKLVDDSGKPIVSDNMQEMGCVEPKWTGSFINSFNIFGVSVNFQIDARIGGVLYSGTWNRATTAGVVAATYEGREEYYLSSVILGEDTERATHGFKWKEDVYYEDGTKCEKYVNPRYQFGSWDSRCVFDASYIKLREVAVGYSIPSRVLKDTPLSAVKVSLVGRNLAILYQNTPKGIDPEAAVSSGNAQGVEYGGMPPVTTFGFDVKISF
ncbi:MAG: SusC/RagA family TonB-linked outer membrane protein [Bacteroidetes bacterium]|uniref:SusC/RagA family TonB-linked outer membrane protein n=1 Tax=Candidatus Cryptobacteroides faecigallinarum TaxID=2840763 RepID=A0A9D9ILN2_9BACT|nr:SusC/RagA family TonB-linked outer membrane protein [Candidatus Cryptobacteroides faecigallinarum]